MENAERERSERECRYSSVVGRPMAEITHISLFRPWYTRDLKFPVKNVPEFVPVFDNRCFLTDQISEGQKLLPKNLPKDTDPAQLRILD
jgi:hypothetical protein